MAERNEAAERSAKCLDKLGRRDEAMALYLQVLYGGVAGDDATSPAPPVILPAPAALGAARAVLQSAAPGAPQQSVEQLPHPSLPRLGRRYCAPTYLSSTLGAAPAAGFTGV